jgi:D-glycero-D-manno-heptose 1,7-bisphosphate phosphatase
MAAHYRKMRRIVQTPSRRMLVLLDRDGVVNQDAPDYIKSTNEWRPIPGSLEAIARLNRAGCVVVICTNQSGVGRKRFTEATLSTIHEALESALAAAGGRLDAIVYCPHRPDDGCGCRKPKPGMLLAARARFATARQRVWYVGDSLRDVEAALAAQCIPVLVRTGNGTNDETAARRTGARHVFDDLAAATRWILGDTGS